MPLRQIYLAAWIVLLSIFAFRNAPKLVLELARGKISRPNPMSSMDRFLETLLQVSRPTERLEVTLASLPAGESILFISPKSDDRWDFVYSAVCYLSWPRKIDRVEVVAGENLPNDLRREGAIMFCGLSRKSSSPGQVAIGPNLIVLRSPMAQ